MKWWFCFLLLLFLTVTPEKIAGQEERSYGGALTYSELFSYDRLNPYLTQNNAPAIRILSLIYEGLVKYDFNRDKIEPWLAESWSISSNNQEILFHLRPNVRWQDNKPFSAYDVKFTIQKMFHSPNAPLERQQQFSFIDSLQVQDSLTLWVRLKKPLQDPLLRFTFEIIPAHVYQENPLETSDADPLDVNPIGTGPFKFQSITPDGRAVLTEFDRYWKGRPYLDKIIRRLDTDQNIQVDALRLGAIDMLVEARPRDVGILRETGTIIVQPYPSLSYYFIGFNLRKPLLKFRAFRKALTLATNRWEMLEKWYGGYGEVISGPFTPRSWAYNSEVQPLPYDIKKAETILDSLQAKDFDGDGFREAYSKKIVLTLKVPISQTAQSPLQNVALAFQAYAKQIGIEVNVVNQPYLRWEEDVFYKHDFDLALGRWTFDPFFNITPLFHSAYIYDGGKNFVGFSDPTVDMLLDRATQATEFVTIKGIYHRLHAILADEDPYIFLFTVNKFVAYHMKFYNITIDPFYFFKDVDKWYIPKRWQD